MADAPHIRRLVAADEPRFDAFVRRCVEREDLAASAAPHGDWIVKLVMTDIGLFEPAGDHYILREIAPEWTVDEIAALTGAPVIAAPDLKLVEI